MADKKTTIQVCIIVLSCILIVGTLNGQSLKHCMEAGNSKDKCFRVINP